MKKAHRLPGPPTAVRRGPHRLVRRGDLRRDALRLALGNPVLATVLGLVSVALGVASIVLTIMLSTGCACSS